MQSFNTITKIIFEVNTKTLQKPGGSLDFKTLPETTYHIQNFRISPKQGPLQVAQSFRLWKINSVETYQTAVITYTNNLSNKLINELKVCMFQRLPVRP